MPKLKDQVLPGEIWKDIPGFEGYFQASTQGRVRRSPDAPKTNASYGGRVLQHAGSGGEPYYRVSLRVRGKMHRELVHRLVARTFLQKMPAGTHVNHIDGDKTNNRVDNLEWTNPVDNVAHAWRTGLSTPNQGESHGRSTLNNHDVYAIRKAYAAGVELEDIAKVFRISTAQVSAIGRNRTWKHLLESESA